MFKFTFLLIIFLCYLHRTVALPPTEENESFLTKFKKKVSNGYNSLVRWFSNIERNIHDWFNATEPITNIYNGISENIESIKSVFSNIATSFAKLLSTSVIKFNLIALALEGYHPEDQADAKDCITAKAVVHLWQQLRTMEKIDVILANVTEDALRSLENDTSRITKLALILLEAKIKEDPELMRGYSKIKSEVESQPPNNTFTTNEYAEWLTVQKVFDQFFQEPLVKRLILNKQFLVNSYKREFMKTDKNAFQHHMLAQSVLRLAKNSTDNMYTELQSAYDEALSYASSKVMELTMITEAANVLFTKLLENIEKNGAMKSALNNAGKDVKVDEEPNYSIELGLIL